MKKMIAAVTAATLTWSLGMFPVLASEETGQDGTEAVKSEYQRICAANSPADMAEACGNAAVNTIYYDREGKEVCSDYLYVDGETAVYEDSNGFVEIYGGNGSYGFDPDQNMPFCGIYPVEGSFEKIFEAVRGDSLVQMRDGDVQVFAGEQEDGLHVVVENRELSMTEYGIWELEEGEYIQEEYAADPETMFLKTVSGWVVPEGEDESRTGMTYSRKITLGGDAYEPAEELMALAANSNKRSVNVVLDPGTDQEQTVSTLVPVGCAAMIILDGEYRTVYADETCTTEFEGDGDYTSDVTVYIAEGK